MPAQRLVLDPEIVQAALEGLERTIGLAIEIEAYLVEVPEPPVDRQVAAPVVGIARQDHPGARLDVGDPVGAGADRRGEGGVFERRRIDRMLGQHRHQAEDQRQLAVTGIGKGEAHRQRIQRLGPGDLGIIQPIVRPALVAEQRPGKQHVLGQHRPAIGKPRLRIQVKRDIAAGIVGLDAFGQQAIEGERLVLAAGQQALDHVAPDLLDGQSLHDHRVEAVESADDAEGEPAALGGVGVGIGHVAEARRQSWIAEHGDAGPGARIRPGRRTANKCHTRSSQKACQHGGRTGPDEE